MSLEALKENCEKEKKIVSDIYDVYSHMNDAGKQEKEFYRQSLNALVMQVKMLNSAVPNLMKDIKPVKELPVQKPVVKTEKKEIKKKPEKKGGMIRMPIFSKGSKTDGGFVTINEKDRKEFLKKFNLSDSAVKDIRKTKKSEEQNSEQKPSVIAGISSKFFRKVSEKVAPKFSEMNDDLKKANIRFLPSVYLSIAFFISSLAFFAGIVLFGVLIILNFSNVIYFWIPFAFFGLSFLGFYLYPASEKSSVKKKISNELPFATIHMSAIASSNIEPTKIFKIVAMSDEYPNVGREINKVIMQVEIYGYDLVTALNNVSRQTSNKILAELLNGFATNITSGGELKNFLEKKAENLLLDYKLERQSYASLAGTFMDIYISILIAGPLIMMMMFIVMNAAGVGSTFMSIEFLLPVSVGSVIIVNIIFLVVLHMKQPSM